MTRTIQEQLKELLDTIAPALSILPTEKKFRVGELCAEIEATANANNITDGQF